MKQAWRPNFIRRRVTWHFTLLTLFFLLGQGALANPPRVSLIEGTALYEPADDVEVAELSINLPLLTGDRVYATENTRIEIQQGAGNLVWIGPNTDLKWLGTEDVLLLDLTAGDVILKIVDSENHKVFTPVGSVGLDQPGVYRLSVNADGGLFLAVESGEAEVSNRFRVRQLKAGEQIIVPEVQSGLTQVSLWQGPDEFDRWAQEREQLFVQVASSQYLDNRYQVGAADLDRYGKWDYLPDYGNVWFPQVGPSFNPYQVGRWLYYPSWGWTWISYEPWGWLPYHYGHWVFYSPYQRWCWYPGSYYPWSGALVDFYYGGGYIGWAPRGYRGWGYSRNGGTRFGLAIGTRGFSFVLQTDFGRGRVGNRSLRRFAGNRVRDFRPGLPRDIRIPRNRGGRNRIVVGNNSDGAGRLRSLDGNERNRTGSAFREANRSPSRRSSEDILIRWRNRTRGTQQPNVTRVPDDSRTGNVGSWGNRQRGDGPRVIQTNPSQNRTPAVTPRATVPSNQSPRVRQPSAGRSPITIPARSRSRRPNTPSQSTTTRPSPRVRQPSSSRPASRSPITIPSRSRSRSPITSSPSTRSRTRSPSLSPARRSVRPAVTRSPSRSSVSRARPAPARRPSAAKRSPSRRRPQQQNQN